MDLLVGGRKDLVAQVFAFREIAGATLHPEAAYLLLRGMKTLHLRIERQNRSALTVARFLERQPQVEAVHYPGLESHPGHDVASRQMRGFGGVLSFGLKGGLDAVRDFYQTALSEGYQGARGSGEMSWCLAANWGSTSIPGCVCWSDRMCRRQRESARRPPWKWRRCEP